MPVIQQNEDDTLYFPLTVDDELNIVVHGFDSFKLVNEIIIKNSSNSNLYPKAYVSIDEDSNNEFVNVISFLVNPFSNDLIKLKVLKQFTEYNRSNGAFNPTPIIPRGFPWAIDKHDVWTVIRSSAVLNVPEFLRILYTNSNRDIHKQFYKFLSVQFEELINDRNSISVNPMCSIVCAMYDSYNTTDDNDSVNSVDDTVDIDDIDDIDDDNNEAEVSDADNSDEPANMNVSDDNEDEPANIDDEYSDDHHYAAPPDRQHHDHRI